MLHRCCKLIFFLTCAHWFFIALQCLLSSHTFEREIPVQTFFFLSKQFRIVLLFLNRKGQRIDVILEREFPTANIFLFQNNSNDQTRFDPRQTPSHSNDQTHFDPRLILSMSITRVFTKSFSNLRVIKKVV